MAVISPSFRARVRSSIEEPVAAFFGRLGFTPNALTLIGFGIAVVGAYFAAVQSWLLAGLIVAFGALFDLFDGALARATQTTSRLGAFLDSVVDRAGEAVMYGGIAVGLSGYIEPGGSALVGVAASMTAMATSFMVSYTRAKSESLGFSSGSGMASVGVAPREVRTVIVVIALVLAGLLRQSGFLPLLDPPTYLYWWFVLVGSLALVAVLATITTIQRMLFVYNQSKSEPNARKENL